MAMMIQPLVQLSDDQLKSRSIFDCGSPTLNSYLLQTAGQHEKRNVARTFCGLQNETIIAYYSLANTEVDVGAVRPEVVKRYRMPMHRLPAVRLCRLAVSTLYHRRGIGGQLLVDAMLRVVAVSNASGCVGLVVDALNSEAARYYEGFGFRPAPNLPLVLFMPLPEIEALLSTENRRRS